MIHQQREFVCPRVASAIESHCAASPQYVERRRHNRTISVDPNGETTTYTNVAGSSLQMGDSHSMPSTGDVSSNHFSEAVVFTSNLFQKLSHPLRSLLKELPTVDGNNAQALSEFLSKVIQISKVGQFKVPILYELLYPYCMGTLLECLGQDLTNRESFDLFHARLLQRFIPRRQLDQLRF